MVQRSDDKGDKRSPGKSSESDASRDAESNAANALRERIRQAGGAATARASDHAPPDNGLLVPHSSAPPAAEHSGVRTRPPEPRSTSITPPLFGPPRLTPGAMAVPWPANGPRKRDAAPTRMGLGPPQRSVGVPPDHAPVDPLRATLPMEQPRSGQLPSSGNGWTPADPADEDASQRTTDKITLPAGFNEPRASHPTPRGVAPPPDEDWVLSNARTQEMPRVRDQPDAIAPDSDERRRAEFATTRKTHGLLRAPDAAGSNVGRYSVHDVSTEYVDTGLPEAVVSEHTADDDDSPEVTVERGENENENEYEADASQSGEPGSDTRPRRSTPKQRVGHRRSSRPEIHARERGTKRTDPGIRARTLRGASGGTTLPGKATPSSPRPAVKTQPLPLPAPAQPSPLPAAKPQLSPVPARNGSRPAPSEDSSVVIDPSLSRPASPPALPVKYEASSYVPLPRDREAYEAFLRSAAGEHGGPPRARPVWAQQETALIPRDALEPSFDDSAEPSRMNGPWARGLLGVVLIVFSAGVLWWVLQDEHPGAPRSGDSATTTQMAPSTNVGPTVAPAARAMTLIATEPSGAELLLDNAVIGNTPLEVARPEQGEVLYLVRLRNFEHQMVRVTNATHEAIHITLVPVGGDAPTPPPSRRR